jgi:hypothetical protein
LKASDIIDGSSVPGKAGLYVLGCYDDRITFFSQQVRALNLIWALNKQEYLSHASRVAVVGGGAAGVMAAAAIALVSERINVDLYELRPELLELQSVSARRSLDPHIYGWPERGATFTNADLPILDWQAGPVQEVRESVLRGFLNIESAVGQRLKVKKQHKITGLFEVNSGGFSMTIVPPTGDTETAQYDVVFLAIGFGTEAGSIHGVPVESYWSDAGIPEMDLSGASTPTFIVSGSGDGSLIDLVAAATKTFDHAAMIRLISTFPGIEKVAEELSKIDEETRIKGSAGASYDLRHEYNARILPKLKEIGILGAVEDSLRPNLNLILQTRSSTVFHLQTSILNRLAAYMVVTIYGAKSLFRHICASDLFPSAAEAGETSFPLWFLCDGERLGANKVFFRRGTDKESIRAPFAALLTRYPPEHLVWLRKHGSAVREPRLLDETRTLFKELAVRYGLPRAQYLQTAYPTREAQIQIEIEGPKTVWSGDLTPEDVASIWGNEITDTKLLCLNTPTELGTVALAVARIAIHAPNISLFGNKQAWESFLARHTRLSDTADDLPLPRISPLGTMGTQQGMQRIEPIHLENRLHAAMDRWMLGRLREDISSFLGNAEDPSHTIGFEIETDLRKEMLSEWQDWEHLLSSSQDRLSRFLRLIVCAQESQASPGGTAAVNVGPRRYKHLIKTTVAALAIASAWKKMSPADHVPGNLLRVKGVGVQHSGFACAADRISGQAVIEVCTSFDWATDFVLLPLQTSSLMIEEIAQEALDSIDSGQPLMNQVSTPARVLVSADREFISALKSGLSHLEAFLQKKESQTYHKLSSAIERHS